MNATIYPTRTCLDDSIANMGACIASDRSLLLSGELLICHGIIAPEGEELFHAWIELRGVIIDSGIFNGQRITFEVKSEEFYSQACVREVTKYTPMQAYDAEKRSGHFGPWVEKYRPMVGKD